MISAPDIEELILVIEDIREQSMSAHNAIIDLILTKTRETLKKVQQSDCVNAERHLRVCQATEILVNELKPALYKLTGRG